MARSERPYLIGKDPLNPDDWSDHKGPNVEIASTFAFHDETLPYPECVHGSWDVAMRYVRQEAQRAERAAHGLE